MTKKNKIPKTYDDFHKKVEKSGRVEKVWVSGSHRNYAIAPDEENGHPGGRLTVCAKGNKQPGKGLHGSMLKQFASLGLLVFLAGCLAAAILFTIWAYGVCYA